MTFVFCFLFLLFRHFAGGKFRTNLLSKSHSKLSLCLWLHINGDHNTAYLELITRLSILLLDERSTGTSRVRRRRVTGHTGRISVQGIWLDAKLPSQLLKGNFVLRKNKNKRGTLTSNECVGVHQRTGIFFFFFFQFLWKHVVCYTCVLREEQNAFWGKQTFIFKKKNRSMEVAEWESSFSWKKKYYSDEIIM